jgi:hypothetical protein
VDLLSILDAPVQTNGHIHNNQLNPLEDLLFGSDIQTNHSNVIPPMTVIDKNGLRIIFTFERENTILTIHSKATNSTPYPITNYIFKAAVPKVKIKFLFFLNKIFFILDI